MNNNQMFINTGNGQRRKIENETENKNSTIPSNSITLSKEEKRKIQMTHLKNKYFNKICEVVIKANNNSKKQIHFYYNYYDFVNDRLGKPHGFLNEFMYEMSYENSEFNSKDANGNMVTFKTLFGFNFHWQLKGKNMMILSW